MHYTSYRVIFADCYVLTDKRTKEFIITFLDAFLPNRREYTNTYEIPQFSNAPTVIHQSASELIEYLEQHKKDKHAIYWYNIEESILRGAMCLFTSDGQIILGLTCESQHPDTTQESNYLKKMMKFCESDKGIIEYKTPAALDTDEFMKRIALKHKRNM